MKLDFVEFLGFRGFKDRTRFEFPSGFAVLTGRNGTGKSTVLDAVDFVLTGSINKYVVTGAKGGGLGEHIWWVGDGSAEHPYVSVGFVDEGGTKFTVTRSRERGLHTPLDDVAHRLCSGEAVNRGWQETLMGTTLIRDETIAALSLDLPEQARFTAVRTAIGGLSGPDYSERTAALVRAAGLARTERVQRVSNAQAELGRALGSLTEARSLAEKQQSVAEAEKLVSALGVDLKEPQSERVEVLRRLVGVRKQSFSELQSALAHATRLDSERRYLESLAARAEMDSARVALEAAQRSKASADEEVERTEKLEVAERVGDAFASHMIALLQHGIAIGLQQGHCPLCDAVRTQEEFDSAVAAARSSLSERGQRASQVATDLATARAARHQAEEMLARIGRRVEELETRRTKYAEELANIQETFARWDFKALPLEPENGHRLLLRRQEETTQLELALFILDTSDSHDRVTALQARVEQLRTQVDEETAKLAAAERAVEAVRQIENAAAEVRNQILTEQFDTVMPLLKELYRRLRPHTDWSEIEVDFGGRVRASLNFTVGDGRNPQFLFSSGQRRAAGMAFLLAIHLSRPWCQLRSLLLDDPVQHVDDYRALNLVEVLSAVRRTGRQVIVAVEDPALADVLCRRLRSTSLETGRRFELWTAKNGSAAVERETNIFPLPRGVLRAGAAS